MRRIKYVLFVMLFSGLIAGCGSRKKVVTKKSNQTSQDKTTTSEVEPVVPPVETSQTEDLTIGMSPVAAYIFMHKSMAQEEMNKYGIPASITLAQGILESSSGKGRLSVEANNHFGIKCHDWEGAKIYHDDDAEQECFRKYNHVKYSYRDHSLFLSSRQRYMDLFKLSKDDYKSWAKGLRKAGYATDKKYPQKLISLIERYKLYTYDAEVLGKDASEAKKITESRDKHFVVKGDTLYSLSKKYKISIKEIQEINGLDSTQLYIGQVLFVKPLSKDY